MIEKWCFKVPAGVLATYLAKQADKMHTKEQAYYLHPSHGQAD